MTLFDNIPQELRAKRQWVVVEEGSKVPLNARTGYAASATSPATWSSFEEAQYAVETHCADYAGYVFANDDVVGLDIDVGFEGGKITPLARDILSACDSYTEISRSGRGFHILMRGGLPFDGMNNGAGVEIYKSKRYFILTGKIFENRTTLQLVNEGLRHVLGAYFPTENYKVSSKSEGYKIYSPLWQLPREGLVSLKPDYPPIQQGVRHISMVSLAGSLHTAGFDSDYILRELSIANKAACQPPLDRSELEAITRSICRYAR